MLHGRKTQWPKQCRPAGTPRTKRREASESLRLNHPRDDSGFVIDHQVGTTLDHRERLVAEDVGNLEERRALRGEHRRRGVASTRAAH